MSTIYVMVSFLCPVFCWVMPVVWAEIFISPPPILHMIITVISLSWRGYIFLHQGTLLLDPLYPWRPSPIHVELPYSASTMGNNTYINTLKWMSCLSNCSKHGVNNHPPLVIIFFPQHAIAIMYCFHGVGSAQWSMGCAEYGSHLAWLPSFLPCFILHSIRALYFWTTQFL